MKKKEERHLCFRCGRKKSISQLDMCSCGKTYWCKKTCEYTGKRQWEKYPSMSKEYKRENRTKLIVSI